jgi:hypothetical protein
MSNLRLKERVFRVFTVYSHFLLDFMPTSRTSESISSLQSQIDDVSNYKRSSTIDDDRISQCSSAFSTDFSKKT